MDTYRAAILPATCIAGVLMTTDALTLPAEIIETPRVPSTVRSLAERIGFRFAFCYWVLYFLPYPFNGLVPDGHYLERPFDWFWHSITPWIAQHLFHLSGTRITYFPTGSGDTTLGYIQNLLCAVIAAAAALVWSLLDRKRKESGTLYAWLRIFVRFTLALTLLSYGLIKIFPTQFQSPSPMLLTRTYGESSPMLLLWTFMGASTPYTIFGGVAEATAGLLLLFRRTSLLGALVAAGVLLNVVMLNFCYDVPVKLYSVNLLLMALFLLLPDFSRLVNVFIFNRTALPAELTRPHLPRRWMRLAARALMAALLLYFVITKSLAGWNSLHSTDSGGPSPVYGVFDVESIEINGKPAAVADPANANWLQFMAENHFWMLKKTDGTSAFFAPTFESKTHIVDLFSWKTHSHVKFNYTWKDADSLILTGKLGNEQVEAHLKKKEFLLTNRGFHWINEEPFAR
jgi:hypothetical protein